MAEISQSNITPRQAELLDLLVQGLRIKEMAAHMGIAFGTAKLHLKAIETKSGMGLRELAMAWRCHKCLLRREIHDGAVEVGEDTLP